jgi:hypothetical protein
VSGNSFTFNGVTFPWAASGGTLDNAIAVGQTISLSAPKAGGTLAFLGAAGSGPATGSGTLNYSDGTSAPFTVTFSDWTLGGGAAPLANGNQIAITTLYRNNANGQMDPTKTYVFFASVPLDGAKTLASVTLPGFVSAGRMHVFSVALGQ